MLALAGPVWGFLGTLAAAAVALITALGVAVYSKRSDAPHVEASDELAGLKASVEALLASMASLRLDYEASERKHEQCLKSLAEKSTQITNLSLEVVHLHRKLEGQIYPPERG